MQSIVVRHAPTPKPTKQAAIIAGIKLFIKNIGTKLNAIINRPVRQTFITVHFFTIFDQIIMAATATTSTTPSITVVMLSLSLRVYFT